MDALGFGSLNIDEFWEVPKGFLAAYGLKIGHEYVRDVQWFKAFYPELKNKGILRAVDPGGSAANTIAALKNMGFSTGFIGTAGKEDAMQLRLEDLGQASNLKISFAEIPSGRCLSLLCTEDPYKDRCLIILPNANDLAGSEEIDPEFVFRFRWLHLTSFVSRSPLKCQIELVRRSAGRVQISFDPGPLYCRLGIELLEPILNAAQILFVTEEELALLSGLQDTVRSAEKLTNLGIRTLIIKKGAAGIEVRDGENVFSRTPPVPSKIVDRTGAGDVVAAGFIAGLLVGADLETATELALAAASQSVQGYGRSAYPDRAIIKDLIRKKRDTRPCLLV